MILGWGGSRWIVLVVSCGEVDNRAWADVLQRP